MSFNRANFPWRLLRKFLIKSSVLFVLIFFSLYIILSQFFLLDLNRMFPLVEWKSFINTVFIIVVGSSFVLFIGMLMFVLFELLLPLGDLYARLKALRDRKIDEQHQEGSTRGDTTEEELEQDEPGEWSDLEFALRSLKSELDRSRSNIVRGKVTLYSLIDATPQPILAADRHGNPIFINTAFSESFGGLNIHDVKNLRIGEMIRSPEVLEAFTSALKTQQKQKIETKIQSKDPLKQKVYQVTVAPLKNLRTNDLHGAVGVFQDVTDLKLMEQIRIDFVANVSHELRTPLTSVKGYAQTLLQDIKERKFDHGEKYLGVIGRNVDRLLALVGDLLELSSIESGVTIQKQMVSTKSITQNVLDQVENTRATKNIQVKTNFSALHVYGDEGRIVQVLLNLIQNAIQYIAADKTVEISWRKVNNYTELSVRDNGPGISAEHTSRIFERFYRVDRARTKESGGTGLGLAIVKHIVQRHGGVVHIESKLGQGTEFICTFPEAAT